MTVTGPFRNAVPFPRDSRGQGALATTTKGQMATVAGFDSGHNFSFGALAPFPHESRPHHNRFAGEPDRDAVDRAKLVGPYWLPCCFAPLPPRNTGFLASSSRAFRLGREATGGAAVGARDQTRWLPADRSDAGRERAPLHPAWLRLERSIPAHRRGGGRAPGQLGHN
jgi:hypothetical protein